MTVSSTRLAPSVVTALDLAVEVSAERTDAVEMFHRNPGRPDMAVPAGASEVEFGGLLTGVVVERTALPCVHAGVVGFAGGCVIVPGVSGLGKSTLTVALARLGFSYLSDEVAGFSRDGTAVHAFPRRPTLAAASLRLLGLDGIDGVDGKGDDGERTVTARELGAVGPSRSTPTVIVLAQRGGVGVEIEDLDASRAVTALIRNSFNHFRAPAIALQAFTEVARQVRVLGMRYEAAPDAARRLADLLG